MKEESQNKMAIEPINKLILKMGLPMIVSMVLQALYNVIDSIFVANMGSTGAIANQALTYAFPIQIMIIAIGVGTGVGLNALLSKSLGENDKNKVNKNIKTNAYIESVEIKRKLPNKVQIQIEERKQEYNVEFLNGYAYINNQGYILQISEEKQALPTIQGISTPDEQIVEGNRLNSEDLEKLEVIIQIMNICKNYELDSKITNIDISTKDEYTLYLEEEKKTIYLGDKSNLSNKMLYVQVIIEENRGKEGAIFVNGDLNNNFKPRFKEKV